MDKWMMAGMLCLLAMNMNMVLQRPTVVESNDFMRLAKLYEEEELPLDAVVLSAWFTVENRDGAEAYLAENWQMKSGESSKRITWPDGSTLQIYRKNATVVTIEMISENLVLANQQYLLWQEFARLYAGQKPVGITFCSNYDELLTKNTRCHLAQEIAVKLATNLKMDIEQDDHESYTFYSSELTQALEIGGIKVNGNLAFVQRSQQTTMYLGSPVIYQQY